MSCKLAGTVGVLERVKHVGNIAFMRWRRVRDVTLGVSNIRMVIGPATGLMMDTRRYTAIEKDSESTQKRFAGPLGVPCILMGAEVV